MPATLAGASRVERAGAHRLPTVPRHFLTGTELSNPELGALLDRALELKATPRASQVLAGRTVALLFEHPSTRTRTSFEAGIVELGGHPMVVRPGELQLSRGESVRDTALVLSRHVAAIGLRTGSEETLAELAEHAEVPVVNMLSPRHHPCQALADLMTMREAFGTIEGRRLGYVGDGNNMARSLAVLGGRAGVHVTVAAPAGYQLDDGTGAELTDDPATAATRADVLYTDVWVSMGDDAATADERRAALAGFRIDDALLDAAAPGAFALHCLPAHPGEEITASVLYGQRQRIWDQAENRRHVQKALLEWLVADSKRPSREPPISGYDDLTAAEVVTALDPMEPSELRRVRDYEKANANRKTVLDAVARKLA
jgi:ornithine carbamoyltransferase